jgi:hypothetical protein
MEPEKTGGEASVLEHCRLMLWHPRRPSPHTVRIYASGRGPPETQETSNILVAKFSKSEATKNQKLVIFDRLNEPLLTTPPGLPSNTPAALPLEDTLYHILPESQGLPRLTIVSLNSQQDWESLTMLQQCPEHGIKIGQNVWLCVPNGPPRAKILQIRQPKGGGHVQVLVALIWERQRIIQDAAGLIAFQKRLNNLWPESEESFQYVLSTEFRILACENIQTKDMDVQLSRNLVYHRPFDMRDTKILNTGAMKEYLTEGGVFWRMEMR